VPLTPEDLLTVAGLVNKIIYPAYIDLWGHYRALLAVAAEATGRNPDLLETDAEAWFVDHHEQLVDEGMRRLKMMFGREAPPPV
jgi:hypothetical protein